VISGHDRFNPVRPATAAALICAAPLLTVAALGVLGPWTDYMDHIARTAWRWRERHPAGYGATTP